jgi:hypothetical protein
MGTEGGSRPTPTGTLVILVLSVSALALALNEAFFNWVLFGDGLFRRFLF